MMILLVHMALVDEKMDKRESDRAARRTATR